MNDKDLRASVEAAIARLQAAMASVANGDVSAIKALYSHTADATSFYGWGGYEKGWDAVARRWDWDRVATEYCQLFAEEELPRRRKMLGKQR